MNYSFPSVAYFSMEYGISSSMKTYSGGLGILAGDYIKSAFDYNYPLTAIGIKWSQGYTNQLINSKGTIFDCYHECDYPNLEDTNIKVKIKIKEEPVYIKIWKVKNENIASLYLLDTDLDENGKNRFITRRLYCGSDEERVAQEMVLGIGGIKALRALNIPIDIYHFNEGHPVFAAFELITENQKNNLTFSESLQKIKKQIVFTTHTPIIHGNETHPLRRLLYMNANLNLTIEQLIEIGGAPFNMTLAALRMSKKSNAVSKLHYKTTLNIWEKYENISDITSITNGIHLDTWCDKEILNNNNNIWNIHMNHKKNLLNFINNKCHCDFKENILLIGSARRATPYKRNDLLFRDEHKIKELLNKKKIQIVFSAKSHPDDLGGKEIVNTLYKLSQKYPESIAFLQDYDINMASLLTKGCDVWLNTPIRTLEACGTSGMKAALNGVLNLSISDGWWDEYCIHSINGWQFGNKADESTFSSIEELNNWDFDCLYNTLLNEVIPTYYNNRNDWIKLMKNSINLKGHLDISRTFKEYYSLLYI